MLLTLRPGQGLGPFVLGKPLPEVLLFLQQSKADYRCVEIKYSDNDTLQNDILVGFPEHGFQLHFEPRSQRLRLVQVVDPTRLQMVYGRNVVFGGAANAPTFGRIYEAFGPTYPGESDAEVMGGYPLQYPGIMFLFPTPTQRQGQTTPAGFDGLGPGTSCRVPKSFPVHLAVVAERVCIHGGTRGTPTTVLASPPPPLDPSTQYMDCLEAVPCHGLYFGVGSSVAVRFGDSPQDVVSQLGQPSWVVPKTRGADRTCCVPDYFYCYPVRGLDLLFCGRSHRLIKAVLHSNVPGHPDFNNYCKCNFRVQQCGWRPPQSCQELPRGEEWPSAAGDRSEDHAAVELAPHPAYSIVPGGVLGHEGLAPPLALADVGVESCRERSESQQGSGDSSHHILQQQQQRPSSSGRAVIGPPAARHPEQGALQEQQSDKAAGGLSAAYQMLVGLIDDVMTMDPQKISLEPTATGSPNLEAVERQAGGGKQLAGAAGDAGTSSALKSEPIGSSAGAYVPAGGKPPKPPTATAASAAPVPATRGALKKKKGKKKKGQLAAVQAPAIEEDSDSLADASASDSGIDCSSPASSLGLTSHIITPPRSHLGLGYQSSEWGSTADLAAKEGSVCGGSALDGWSDADDLFPVTGGQSDASIGGNSPVINSAAPRGVLDIGVGSSSAAEDESLGFEGGDASLASWAVPSAPAGSATSALTTALSGHGACSRCTPTFVCEPSRVNEAVQTSAAAVGPGYSQGIFSKEAVQLADLEDGVAWVESDSPQGYVIPDRPSMFDEGAAEYERVPQQRDCSTQTPALALTRSSAASQASNWCQQDTAGSVGSTVPSQGAGAALSSHTAAVTADSRLEDIQAAFGHQGGPALHNRLGCGHPFGNSYLYAYRGVVFEVLQNGLIATVTLFKP